MRVAAAEVRGALGRLDSRLVRACFRNRCRSRSGPDLSGSGGGAFWAKRVRDLRVGDEIFGVTNPSFTGAYAEYALAQVGMISRKSPSLSHEQAAGIPVTAVTAKQMLFTHADVRAGQLACSCSVRPERGSPRCAAGDPSGKPGRFPSTVTNEADRAFVADLGARQVVDCV